MLCHSRWHMDSRVTNYGMVVAAQGYLQQKLLSAGYRVPESGAALERMRSDEISDSDVVMVASGGGDAACSSERAAPAEHEVLCGAASTMRLDGRQDELEQDTGSAQSSHAEDAAGKAASISCAAKQDVLRYKEGRLSKHDLLVATAKRRVASRRN